LLAFAVLPPLPDAAAVWVRIHGSLDADESSVVVEVVGNGRGVAEADRPRLFQRFLRAEATADVEGTGLGLALVREAVERAGGRMKAEIPARSAPA
jgi:two-component system, OmpR family, sensor histidine kinase MprB